MELHRHGVLEEEEECAELLAAWSVLDPHDKKLLLDLARAFASRETPVAAEAPDWATTRTDRNEPPSDGGPS